MGGRGPRAVIRYEVTLAPGAGTDPVALERYMRATHIPDVLATGCFTGAAFAADDDGRFRTTYLAAARADLDRYLATHAARLRADFAAHWGEGVAASRAVWEDREQWPGAPGR